MTGVQTCALPISRQLPHTCTLSDGSGSDCSQQDADCRRENTNCPRENTGFAAGNFQILEFPAPQNRTQRDLAAPGSGTAASIAALDWPPSRFTHAAEGGPIHGPHAVLGLAPPPGASPARPRGFLPVRFPGGTVQIIVPSACAMTCGFSLRGQHAEGLIVLGLQLRARPAGRLERGAAHGADVHRKAIMFLHAAGGPRQGLFAAKVRQHPAQPPGPSRRR